MKRFLSLVLLLSGWAVPSAFAQEPAPVPPPQGQVQTEEVSADGEAAEPIRARRRWALLGEAGWNGLAGVGANVGFHIFPRLSVEGGLGLSSFGLKTGLRARVNFLTSNWTPFLAGGFAYGTGSGAAITLETENNPYTFRVHGSPMVQAVTGVEFTGDSGFTFLGTVGWMQQLRQNVEIVSGTPTANQRIAEAIAYGSGVVFSVAFGYTF